MKKQVVFAGLLLLSFLAHSQEADNLGGGAGITIIPRLDFNPRFNLDDDESEISLGNSSLYSLFEGDISEHLSFSICNHWLSDDPKSLYQNTLRSDDCNWLDWALLTWEAGNFTVNVGKDMITTGGFELYDDDFEVHPDMLSGLWHNLACYQWGFSVGYTAFGNTTFSLQMSASPYGERPFSSGLYNYSFQWLGDYDFLRTMWAATALQTDTGNNFEYLISLGQEADAGDFTFRVDYANRVGDEDLILRKGHTLTGQVSYEPCDKWAFIARAGTEIIKNVQDNWLVGVAAHWFPLRDNQDLRIHFNTAYNSGWGELCFTLGAIYYLNFKVW